jgi:ABC-2 type transport system ATP-binding protein
MQAVGAVLEASSFHPGRTARNHLRVYAAASGIPDVRADEVLEQVGLTEAAHRKVRGFSLGMRQRLGLAFALLGDPQVLLLDEPANGLDPEGIRWLRRFQRALADAGKTVLVSSHLLTEVQQSADRVVILSQGRLVREGSMDELEKGAGETVVVRTPTVDKLGMTLADAGANVTRSGETELRVRDMAADAVGHRAFEAGVELHELRTERADLEQLFFALTEGQYRAPDGSPPPPGTVPAGLPPMASAQAGPQAPTTPGGAR